MLDVFRRTATIPSSSTSEAIKRTVQDSANSATRAGWGTSAIAPPVTKPHSAPSRVTRRHRKVTAVSGKSCATKFRESRGKASKGKNMKSLATLLVALVLAACSDARTAYDPPQMSFVGAGRNTAPLRQSQVPNSATSVQLGVEETISSRWIDRMFYDREDDAELTYTFVSGDTALTVRVEGVGDSATAYLLGNNRSRPVSVTLTAIDPDSATASHSWSVSIRQANPGTTDPVNPPPPPPPPPPVPADPSSVPRTPPPTPPPPPPPPPVTPPTSPPPPVTPPTSPPPPPDTTTYCASNGSDCSPPAKPTFNPSAAIVTRTYSSVSVDASAVFSDPTDWGSGPNGAWSSGSVHYRFQACGWTADGYKIGCDDESGLLFTAAYSDSIPRWSVDFFAMACNDNPVRLGDPLSLGCSEEEHWGADTYRPSATPPPSPPPVVYCAADGSDCSPPGTPSVSLQNTISETNTNSGRHFGTAEFTIGWSSDHGTGPNGSLTRSISMAEASRCPLKDDGSGNLVSAGECRTSSGPVFLRERAYGIPVEFTGDVIAYDVSVKAWQWNNNKTDADTYAFNVGSSASGSARLNKPDQ